jgi:hypothetical protein
VKRVILHAGPHKTGTTYIQRHLDANADVLRGQGILVPTEWRDSAANPSHTGLTTHLFAGEYDAVKQTIAGWNRTGCHTAIISTEVLVDIGEAKLQALKDMLPDAHFTAVLYVRRWSELLLSAWHEDIVHGSRAGLLETILPTIDRPASSRFVNFTLHVAQFIKIFGRAAVKIVAYNTLIEQNRDIFAHFMFRVLGIKLKPADAARVNASWPPPLLELVRILNHLDQSLGHARSGRMAARLRARSDIDSSQTLHYLARFQRAAALSDGEGDISELLEQNWQDYRDLTVPPVPASRFYAPSVTRLPYISADYALAPGFAETVRALRDELLK